MAEVANEHHWDPKHLASLVSKFGSAKHRASVTFGDAGKANTEERDRLSNEMSIYIAHALLAAGDDRKRILDEATSCLKKEMPSGYYIDFIEATLLVMASIANQGKIETTGQPTEVDKMIVETHGKMV